MTAYDLMQTLHAMHEATTENGISRLGGRIVWRRHALARRALGRRVTPVAPITGETLFRRVARTHHRGENHGRTTESSVLRRAGASWSLALIAFAAYRADCSPRRRRRRSSRATADRPGQLGQPAEASDTGERHHGRRNTAFAPRPGCREVKGISAYKPLRGQHGPVRPERLGRLGARSSWPTTASRPARYGRRPTARTSRSNSS